MERKYNHVAGAPLRALGEAALASLEASPQEGGAKWTPKQLVAAKPRALLTEG